MPNLSIDTNLPRSKIPADFVQNATNLLAQLLNRTTDLVSITIYTDLYMTSAGASDQPIVNATVSSIGRLAPEQNKKYTPVLIDFINRELGVPRDKVTIVYSPATKENIGFLPVSSKLVNIWRELTA